MHVAQWIELSVGDLSNGRIPKLAGCLKHQLHYWAHFAFLLFSSNILENYYSSGLMD